MMPDELRFVIEKIIRLAVHVIIYLDYQWQIIGPATEVLI